MNQPSHGKEEPLFSFSALWKQVIRIIPALLISSAVALGGTTVTVLVARLTDNPIWKLAKDPADVIQFQPYIGMLSNWGALLWMTTAAICLFTAVILKTSRARLQTRLFIFFSGVLSLLLAVDDLYMFHDRVLPRVLNIHEYFFYMLYIILILAYLVAFTREILRQDFILFVIAFGFLFLSRRFLFRFSFLDEYMTTGDMLKYFGIVFWLAFYYRAASREISALIQRPKPDATP